MSDLRCVVLCCLIKPPVVTCSFLYSRKKWRTVSNCVGHVTSYFCIYALILNPHWTLASQMKLVARQSLKWTCCTLRTARIKKITGLHHLKSQMKCLMLFWLWASWMVQWECELRTTQNMCSYAAAITLLFSLCCFCIWKPSSHVSEVLNLRVTGSHGGQNQIELIILCVFYISVC